MGEKTLLKGLWVNTQRMKVVITFVDPGDLVIKKVEKQNTVF